MNRAIVLLWLGSRNAEGVNLTLKTCSEHPQVLTVVHHERELTLDKAAIVRPDGDE